MASAVAAVGGQAYTGVLLLLLGKHCIVLLKENFVLQEVALISLWAGKVSMSNLQHLPPDKNHIFAIAVIKIRFDEKFK